MKRCLNSDCENITTGNEDFCPDCEGKTFKVVEVEDDEEIKEEKKPEKKERKLLKG